MKYTFRGQFLPYEPIKSKSFPKPVQITSSQRKEELTLVGRKKFQKRTGLKDEIVEQARMTTFIPPQAQKRLLRDIRTVLEGNLKHQGIWYVMDESNIINGHAMIRGPEGTPYADCLLFFSFEFPPDYPFSPPKVIFLTGDGKTRMHPNLYVGGKVCLSILGTFPGPSWSANMSLETILLNLQSLLDENPLANEPAYTIGKLTDKRHLDYAEAVEHQMILYMEGLFRRVHTKIEGYWTPFEEEILSLQDELLTNLIKRCEGRTETQWSTMYGMLIRSHWSQLKEEFQRLSRKCL